MSKLNAIAIKAIAYTKPYIVTIERISLLLVAIAAVAKLELVESSEIQCHQQQLWLIGSVTTILLGIWALNLFGDYLPMRAIAPARLSYLRSDSLCC